MQQAIAPSAARRGEPNADRLLRVATALFVAAFLFHNADHLRRGVGVLSAQVIGGGTVLALASVLAVALVVMGHGWAPLVAVLVGVPGAIGVAATHLLPTWGAFSDSFPSLHLDGISWAAGISEVVALLLLAAAGFNVLRQRATAAQSA
jgi:hypothetical protein